MEISKEMIGTLNIMESQKGNLEKKTNCNFSPVSLLATFGQGGTPHFQQPH